MGQELECLKLENNLEYAILEKIKKDNYYYVYLFNTNDTKDFCIRKLSGNVLTGLDNNEEFDEALLLLKKHNQELMVKIGL